MSSLVAQGGAEDSDLRFSVHAELRRRARDRLVPAHLHGLPFLADQRRLDAVLGIHMPERLEPALVAHPVVVHVGIVPRGLAQDLVVAHPGVHRAAAGAARTDGLRGRHLPDTRPEPEIAARQRTHRTDVDRVHGVRIVQLLAGEGGQLHVVAALRERQLRRLSAISAQNRTHREHMMHRSVSSITCGPSSTRFGLWTLSSAKRLNPMLCAYA